MILLNTAVRSSVIVFLTPSGFPRQKIDKVKTKAAAVNSLSINILWLALFKFLLVYKQVVPELEYHHYHHFGAAPHHCKLGYTIKRSISYVCLQIISL